MNRLLIPVLLLLLFSGAMGSACKSGEKKKPVAKLVTTQSEVPAEGRLVRFEKLNDQNYNLYVHVTPDTTATLFKTVLILDENEISMLKKEGNNIRLRYNEIVVPETKDTFKVVRYLEPMYEGR